MASLMITLIADKYESWRDRFPKGTVFDSEFGKFINVELDRATSLNLPGRDQESADYARILGQALVHLAEEMEVRIRDQAADGKSSVSGSKESGVQS